MVNFKCIFYCGILALSLAACSDKTTINGTIDYLGDSHIILQQIPVHYKYAPIHQDTIEVSETGNFTHTLKVQEPKIWNINIGDASYPLYLSPNSTLKLTITRADFPENVIVEGYEENWDQLYSSYLKAIAGLERDIAREEERMKEGKQNQWLNLSQQKYKLAEQYLKDTPLKSYYLKTIGEYLVFKTRTIEYCNRFDLSFDADSARKALLTEADSLNFFSAESLKAQRAGIRDFTHFYARTFGIYDSVKAIYGQHLSEYDIKQVAYEELNQKRVQVLNYIKERDALAHAKMYLIAERIGEQGIEVAQPTYHSYLDEFSDYPEYTEFLQYFYNEITSVSPGQPAVPFALPDIDGNIHTMEDYHGTFVLLDFWAGWCQPCLNEFPFMKDLYEQYSRDELEIIGISNEKDSLVWVQDINRLDLPWPQLYGGNGFQEKTFKAYKGGGIPFYILIDPDGKIARYNDIRASFNFTSVFDSLLSEYNKTQNQ